MNFHGPYNVNIKGFTTFTRNMLCMKKILWFVLYFLLIFSPSRANQPLETFLKAEPLKGASVGILLINSTKNDTVINYNSGKSLIPASLMKLVTTGTALELLEPNFKFGTKIYTNSRPGQQGTLLGKVIINAAGDPTLASKYINIKPEMVFDVIAQTLLQNNIRRIEGGIEVNTSIFDTQVIPPGWSWEDIGNYYAAPTYSFAWRDNAYEIHLKSGAPGSAVEVTGVSPEIKNLKIDCFATASNNNKDSAYVYGAPYSYYQYISGTIPCFQDDFVIKGSIPNPAEQFNNELIAYLNSKGIEVKNVSTSDKPLPENSKLLKALFSPSLHEIVNVTNKESVNIYAEYILKHLSLKSSHTANREKGIMYVEDYWRRQYINTKYIIIKDGSGLSPQNRLTPEFLVSMLDHMRNKSSNAPYFLKSLPIAGEDGTLKNFLKYTNLEKHVYAKSGSMNGVRCYAGYIHGPSNNIYTFCIMINNYTGDAQGVTILTEDLLVQSIK